MAADGTRVQHFDAGERAAHGVFGDTAADHFDLGQLRHERILPHAGRAPGRRARKRDVIRGRPVVPGR
ncbi:hypothetical protein GCM10027597_36700 [Saccharopolyspora tripterygii]